MLLKEMMKRMKIQQMIIDKITQAKKKKKWIRKRTQVKLFKKVKDKIFKEMEVFLQNFFSVNLYLPILSKKNMLFRNFLTINN